MAFWALLLSSAVNLVANSTWTLLNKWQFSPAQPAAAAGTDGALQAPPPAGKMWGYGVTTPLIVTGAQMIIAGMTASFFIFVLGIQRRSRRKDGAPPAPALFTWDTMRNRILPLGLARGTDIGCSNAALLTISVAVQQVTKSMMPVFVSLLSVTVFKVHVSRAAWAALIPIVVGTFMVTMTSKGENSGKGPAAEPTPVMGVLLVAFGCCARSFKAVLNSRLLKPESSVTSGSSGSGPATTPSSAKAPMKPLEILLLEAPTSGMMLILIGLCVERDELSRNGGAIVNAALLNLFGGFLMFFSQWAYITVIEKSSPVTCEVIMNAKLMSLVLVSVYLFGTPFSSVNYCGVLVAACGCVLYSLASSRKPPRAKAD